MDVQKQLAEFVISEFGDEGGPISVRPDDDLIKQGIVDSMGVLQIVAFIEQTYGVRVADEELIVENFRSITSIASLIARKIETPA